MWSTCEIITCEIGTTTCGSHVELSHVKWKHHMWFTCGIITCEIEEPPDVELSHVKSEEPHVVLSDVATKQVNSKKFTVT